MRLSVVIPVYRAQRTLTRALDSLPQREGVELVLCIDDGDDYSALLSARDDLVVLTSPTPRSGPGAVRNRCIAAASGDFVMFLDADDSYAPGSLEAILPALGPDALFPHMRVLTEGAADFAFTDDLEQLDLETLATRPFTYHPILRRDWAGPFHALVAQDVFHAAEALALNGGTARLVRGAEYRIHRQANSVSTSDGYEARIDHAYRTYAKGSDRLTAPQNAGLKRLFDARVAFNQRYCEQAQPGEEFYDFWLRVRAAA